jgi:hypothetical protein
MGTLNASARTQYTKAAKIPRQQCAIRSRRGFSKKSSATWLGDIALPVLKKLLDKGVAQDDRHRRIPHIRSRTHLRGPDPL